jgi:hypothetical protein
MQVRDMEDRRRPARISAKECMPRYSVLTQREDAGEGYGGQEEAG